MEGLKEEYLIELEGPPIAWKRAGVNFFQKRYYDIQKTEKAGVASHVKASITEPLEGSLAISFKFSFPFPKSFSPKKRTELEGKYYSKKPDIDNCCKFLLDAMNNVAYLDDSQVCYMTLQKVYSSSPKTEIKIYRI